MSAQDMQKPEKPEFPMFDFFAGKIKWFIGVILRLLVGEIAINK